MNDGAVEDRFKREHTCSMCGCLMEHEHKAGLGFWFGKRDFACELCRLEYQDSFEELSQDQKGGE